MNHKITIMCEKEMNSYRFGQGVEPTDEMLDQIMSEVAIDVRESSERVEREYLERMNESINANKDRVAERLNSIIYE